MNRIPRLAEALARSGLEAVFLRAPVTMGYVAGLFEDGHERFLTLAVRATGETELICPALTASQAERVGVGPIRAWRDGEDPLALYADLARRWGIEGKRVALDPETPARMTLAMQRTTAGVRFEDGGPLIEGLMRRKDGDEIARMRRAAEIADRAWEEVRPLVRPGLTEREVAAMLNDAMTRRGGRPQFAIVATGPNGAEPHHETDDTVLKEGDVVILDFGCEWDRYQSDITRTIALGQPDPEAERGYVMVLAAYQAAREAARPGVSGAEVDAAARRLIEDAGYGEFFVHRTGHGIGMRGHEAPNLVSSNAEPLAEGDCFSVEPGIYLPGRFGVRIENIVTLTAGGCESLNAEPGGTIITTPAPERITDDHL